MFVREEPLLENWANILSVTLNSGNQILSPPMDSVGNSPMLSIAAFLLTSRPRLDTDWFGHIPTSKIRFYQSSCFAKLELSIILINLSSDLNNNIIPIVCDKKVTQHKITRVQVSTALGNLLKVMPTI